MPDLDSIARALQYALEVTAYGRLGPVGESLAEAARRDLSAATLAWTEPHRVALASAAVRLAAQQADLDRGRNHFIRDFRGRHGADPKAWAPGLQDQYDTGIARFTRRKSDALELAASRLAAELNFQETRA
jgi:hypothetical protein